MKKLKLFILPILALALLLTQLACAEPSDVVKGIFDALTAEDTDYSRTKAMYAEYYPETVYEETLEDDGFTIAITGDEWMDGSWTFTQDGDYLTADISDGDFIGMMMVMEIVSAVGDYYGVDGTLMSGYVNGLSALDLESDNFSMPYDESTGTFEVRIYIAAPWDMKELDQMVLDETVVSPMEEGYSSATANLGKLMMVANDDGDSFTILLGEYDHLDDLAFQSMVNAVSILKPEGWESFTENYTGLSDAAFDNCTVTLSATGDMVAEIIEDASENYEYAIIRFDTGDAYAEADDAEGDYEAPAESGIDYLALVNKLNPLPEGWEDALETVTIVNSVGDEVEVEAAAFAAYELLRVDLEENDGIYIELDSARRTVAEQQDIMDRFIEKYGADYAAKTVATPGYSEHHTGLALDLYFRLEGEDGEFTDVYYNEDMVQYPEIWAVIHAKLADYGFILRYPEGKEHITGYGYEPWHIRYVGSPEIAREIMAQPGMTLEVYLGSVNDTDPTIDLGESELYTEDEMAEAIVQIKCKFATFEGCELHAIRYAGDACSTGENLAWLNSLDEGADYVDVIEFVSDFHTPAEDAGAWDPDAEYADYQWWLARSADGGWQLVSWGY